MKRGKMLIIGLVFFALLAIGYLIGNYGAVVKEAHAADTGASVSVVSEDFNILQILDNRRSVVCYVRTTPAGTSISCVKY